MATEATVHRDADADPRIVQGRKIAVIGFGSQGSAQALNLRDSGCDVRVGLREGSFSRRRALAAGLRVTDVAQAAEEADVVMLLVPDEAQADVLREVEPHLRDGDALGFAHGLAVQSGLVRPPASADADVFLVAPKASGARLRERYVAGEGEPCLVAVRQDASGAARELALSYAWAIGCTRAGAVESTFKEEVASSLFGQQAVLYGGVPALMEAAFDELVASGCKPEVAYLSCVHQLGSAVELVCAGGLSNLRYDASSAAEFGGYEAGERIVDDHVREALAATMERVRDGSFARAFLDDAASGGGLLEARRMERGNAAVEDEGAVLRARLSSRFSF